MFEHFGRYRDGTEFLQERLGSRYCADFIPGNGTLVITFYARGNINPRTVPNDFPWGYRFIHSQGLSILGIKPMQIDWYRGAELHDFFQSADFQQWVAGFDRVILYGCSMGGYGALAFSGAIPGSEVLSLSPQSTLASDLIPWEQRYVAGRALDWSGAFADAAATSQAAKKVHVVYDPFVRPDRLHIDRLTGTNVSRLLLPLVGHNTIEALVRMGRAKWLFGALLDGTLTPAAFVAQTAGRRQLPGYYIELARQTKSESVRRVAVQSARALIGTQPMTGIALSMLEMARGDLAEAEATLRNVLAEAPSLPHAPYRLSRLLQRQGRHDEALEYAQSAVTMQANNPTYRKNLDFLLANQSKRLARLLATQNG